MLKWIACFAFLAMTINNASAATKSLNLNEFKKIIIVEQGRLKPLDTYARNLALKFSGRSKVNGKEAIYWFAELLFKPEKTYDTKVFLINNPEVLEAIGIEPDKHRRYSFKELEPGIEKLHKYAASALEKEEADRTPIEKEFLRVFNNFHNYIQLINSLQFNAKHSDFGVENEETRTRLSLKYNGNSLFQIIQKSEQLELLMSQFSSRSENQLRGSDRDIVRLAFNLYRWIENHRSYTSAFGLEDKLAIIPVQAEDASLEWISPWELLLRPEVTYKQELFDLNIMYKAYNAANQEAFNKIVSDFRLNISKKLLKYNIAAPKINTEIFYNNLNPFGNAKFLYGFAFLLSMIASLVWTRYSNLAALVLLVSGFLIHTIGIISRIIILSKPPVTNLFETFIFVSWIVVLLGLIIYLLDRKSNLGLILASFSGLVLLLISGKFAADGDTMQVLIAVLNSNFWLSTHVICVTIGYAGVFAAGIVGHIYLIQKITLILTRSLSEKLPDARHASSENAELTDMSMSSSRNEHNTADGTFRIGSILGILGFGLCFSFLGTMLGGIWADQSWGRFWGWDPKENGALLIVLWSVIIFHARMAGLIKETGIAIASVFGCVVVMTSWFGINLLGVGLHSYGFTQGVALWLYSFYAFELVFILVSIFILSRFKSKVVS